MPTETTVTELPWGVVTQVTTPLALLALVVVVWYLIRLQTLRAESTRLRNLPEDERAAFAQQLANKYGVPVSDLPTEARVEIVKQELGVQAQERRRTAWFLFAGFTLTALLWFASIVAPRYLTAEDVGPVRREVFSMARSVVEPLAPQTICAGNPAEPPGNDCLALLGPGRLVQSLVVDVADSSATTRIAGAVVHLSGAVTKHADSPSCMIVSVNGVDMSAPVPLSLKQLTRGDRLSDEPDLSVMDVRLPKPLTEMFARGTNFVTLRVPDECAGDGFVAVQTASLALEWQS